MTTNSASNLKSRLRVVPIDVWSTREKLCLASSVLKSGDQNWSSVSRPLKAFGEPNRPNDWFHQKYCAIQYQDLLEKIETETPKRKRSERGEETPQTIIVRNLTKQRIEELRKITQIERDLIFKVKQDLDLLKNKQMDEKRFEEICNEIKEKELKEKEFEIEHKKWLEERELKIAQMNRKGSSLHLRQKASTPVTPSTPVVTQPLVTNTPTGNLETVANSPLTEPLKVEVDSELTSSQTLAQNQTNDNKIAIALTSPTTSPLLTSLLQSPTPSTPTLLSPTKSGLSVNTFNRQKPLSQVSTPLTAITRRPSIHSSPEKVNEIKSIDKSEPISTANTVNTSPVVNTIANNTQSEQQISSENSKLSKLLESPVSKTVTTTVTTNAIQPQETDIEDKTDTQIQQIPETEQIVEKLDEKNTSSADNEEIRAVPAVKTNDLNQNNDNIEEVPKEEESNERLIEITDENDDSKTDKESDDLRVETNETENSIDNKTEELNEKIEIKQEFIESIGEEVEQQKQIESMEVKEETMDAISNTSTEDANQRTPSTLVSTRANKRRKTPNPITITPTVMRRSKRVALKDSKSTNDDSTEVSDQSAANTPLTVKKRGSIDDTTETSMSEESMDAKIAPTATSSETVPNSPVSSVRTEDVENSKEYRTWKKAVMVNWRLISAHKNASLFSHPVTETEAKGYEDIVHRPMDLNSIKKRVENGVIRTTTEYQRDIMLMFQNAIMFNNANHDVHKMAVDMQKDTIANIEEFIETRKHDNQSNESKLRARDRRSNVQTLSPLITESEISGRRKSRGASTDTDSGTSSLTKSVIKKKKI